MFLSACAAPTVSILDDRHDVGLNEIVRVGFKNNNNKDVIDEIVLTLNGEELLVTYDTIGNNIVELKGSEYFKPKEIYHLEIILQSGKKYNLDFHTISQYAQDENDLRDNLFIMPVVEDYDVEEANIMKERILSVSPLILVSLYRSGVRMKFTNGPITDEPELEYLKGVTPRGWEYTGLTWDDVPGAGGYDTPIARIGYSEPLFENNHGSINLELHEFAHSVDNYITGEWNDNSLSSSDEFLDIWESEVEGILSDSYFINYNEEYFAEVFAMYYLDETSRLELVTYAPRTFDYIDNLDRFVEINIID